MKFISVEDGKETRCIEADIEGISKPFGMIIWFSLDITFPSQSETIHASWTNLGQLSSLELGAL